MIGWWKHAHRHGHHHGGGPGCGTGDFEARAECGPGPDGHEGERQRWGHWGREAAFGGGHDHDGHFGGFGVRRPLRFLAYKLELEEGQVEELASILNDLKTERAQGEVDHRRSTAVIAASIAGETLDSAKLAEATEDRVKSAQRLRDAVVKAIGRIHAMLTAEQRSRFAYLIRTGALSI
jgi:Spy/CpxP family protein refolding chaperone